MLKYTKTLWVDHIQEVSELFNFEDYKNGTAKISLIPGIIHQQGTPVTAARLNNIENMIEMLVNMINDHERRLTNIEIFMSITLGLDQTGLRSNRFFEDFSTLNDVEISNGIYDSKEKRIYI